MDEKVGEKWPYNVFNRLFTNETMTYQTNFYDEKKDNFHQVGYAWRNDRGQTQSN